MFVCILRINDYEISKGEMEMCILCGEFVEQLHWTDIESKQFDTVVAGQHQRDRKRSRDLRTKICNEILHFYSINLKEWNNSKFLMTNNKGKMEVLQDLGQIWQKSEEMIGKPIDPLDPLLLERLK